MPQIAVKANDHFLVDKIIENRQTYINIRKIIGDDRIEEIARMLGGKEISSVVIDHARELLGNFTK